MGELAEFACFPAQPFTSIPTSRLTPRTLRGFLPWLPPPREGGFLSRYSPFLAITGRSKTLLSRINSSCCLPTVPQRWSKDLTAASHSSWEPALYPQPSSYPQTLLMSLELPFIPQQACSRLIPITWAGPGKPPGATQVCSAAMVQP